MVRPTGRKGWRMDLVRHVLARVRAAGRVLGAHGVRAFMGRTRDRLEQACRERGLFPRWLAWFEYRRWVSCIEPLATEPMAGGAASSRFEWRPLVRVVPIASDDDADLLRLAETLARQTYDRWELHAPLGGQVATSSRRRLVEMAVGDPRFRPALEEPQAASAHDGLVAVVEPGTRLAPFALLAGVSSCTATTISSRPAAAATALSSSRTSRRNCC